MFRDRILAVMGNAKFGSKPYYISMLMSEFTEAHDILFETGSGEFTAVVTPNTYAGADAQAKLEMDVASWLADDNNVMLGHRFNVVAPVEHIVNVYIRDELPPSARGTYYVQIELPEYSSTTLKKVKELFNVHVYGGSLSFGVFESQGLNLEEEFDFQKELELKGHLKEFIGTYGYSTSLDSEGDGNAFVFEEGENKYRLVYHD